MAIALLAAGVLFVAPLAGAALAAATAGSGGGGLGGYGMFADGNGIQATFDNPGGLGGSHPVGYVGVPETSAKMETGPQGNGLATVVWPGSLLGNLGSASNVLTFLPPSITALMKNSNDPIRAQTSYPGGPADATYPAGQNTSPVAMASHADASKVDSSSAVSGFSLAGLFSVGSVNGHGLTALDGPADAPTAATSTASSFVGGIDILGGLLHIDSIKSTATASSDGTLAKGSANTVVSGVSLVGGKVPATIDSTGVHLASSSTPLGAVLNPVNDLLNQVLKNLNFTAVLLKPVNTVSGGQDNAKAGAVVITYSVPANISSLIGMVTAKIPQIPNFFQGGVVTLSLGGATANVLASPGFVAPPSIAVPGVTASGGTGGTGGGSALTGSSGLTGTLGSGGSGGASPAPSGGGGGGSLLPTSPIAAFGGLAPILFLLAMAGAAMIGAGMWKLSDDVLAEQVVPARCPLEDTP
jgi:hypothetical protein